MPRGHTIKGGESIALEAAEKEVNGHLYGEGLWQITYHENRHSSWYHAETLDGETKFDRASLTDLIEICKILNGARPPWRS